VTIVNASSRKAIALRIEVPVEEMARPERQARPIRSGRADLSESAEQKLVTLAKALTDRPGLKIDAGGRAIANVDRVRQMGMVRPAGQPCVVMERTGRRRRLSAFAW